jgi:nucleotide-binding universal stress UspA family protein
MISSTGIEGQRGKRRDMFSIQIILAPVNFSAKSGRAAEIAASLAVKHNARLYLLYITDPIPNIGRIGAGFHEAVQQASIPEKRAQLSKIVSQGIKATIPVEEIHIAGTPVHQVIVQKAKGLAVDVIVMPAPGPRGLRSFLKKNVAALVLQHAPCHVLFVKQEPHK